MLVLCLMAVRVYSSSKHVMGALIITSIKYEEIISENNKNNVVLVNEEKFNIDDI